MNLRGVSAKHRLIRQNLFVCVLKNLWIGIARMKKLKQAEGECSGCGDNTKHINFPRDIQTNKQKMMSILALKSITPTFGDLKFPDKSVTSSSNLLRTICTYKWNFAKSYLDSRPDILSVQVGYHSSKWEWWLIKSEFGFLQCTLFEGKVMAITPFMDDDTFVGVVETPPISPIAFPTVA